MNTMSSTTSAEPGKYLTFTLQTEHFSVPVLRVREIMRLCAITPVPRMPPYIKGVLNLRGKIIPVIDLRDRFSLQNWVLTEDDRRCIIVVQFRSKDNQTQHMGMIVDAVEDVAHFSDADIETTPDFGSALDTRYIIGMATNHGSVRTLLDLDRLLNMEGVLQLISTQISATEPP
jgi:purine-binding chemotaxis protein CheW